jgi:hypothetical protein
MSDLQHVHQVALQLLQCEQLEVIYAPNLFAELTRILSLKVGGLHNECKTLGIHVRPKGASSNHPMGTLQVLLIKAYLDKHTAICPKLLLVPGSMVAPVPAVAAPQLRDKQSQTEGSILDKQQVSPYFSPEARTNSNSSKAVKRPASSSSSSSSSSEPSNALCVSHPP